MGKGEPEITAQTSKENLAISAATTLVRKNGIEFRSGQPVEIWTEMTLDFFSPFHDRRLQCKGVVVSCHGNRHQGYSVSMLFTNISETALEILTQLHRPQLGN